jgi:hypothetical protein
VITLIATVQLLLTIFIVRWMGTGAARFWLAGYAVVSCAGIATVAPCARRRSISLVALLLGVWALVPVLQSRITHVDRAMTTPDEALRREPSFLNALRHIPEGSRILLFANGNAQDFPLYAPQGRIVNEVYSWGASDASIERMDTLIERHRITHVLFERTPKISAAWVNIIDVEPLIEALRRRNDTRELKLPGQGRMILFATPYAQPAVN